MRKYVVALLGFLQGCTPYGFSGGIGLPDFAVVAKYLNVAQLIIGVILGAALILSLLWIFKFIKAHYKEILILCAVLTAIGIFLIAIK